MSRPENDDLQTLTRRQAILTKFGTLALRSDDLDEILTEACRLVAEAMDTDLAKVVELHENRLTLLVRAGVGWKPGVVGVATIVALDDTSEGHALKMGAPMISPDIATETRFRYPPFLIDNGVRAVANVPIIGGKDQQPFGILQVDSREPRQFTERDTDFLSGYANLLAAAVDRLRILQQLRDSEAQLRQSQKLEVIGRLAAGVAHDFNNLLQTITGGLELMLDNSEEGATTREFAQIALNATKRGSQLTNHLLSYARVQMLQPKQIDIAAFMSDMKRLLARTLGHHIMLKVRVDLDLPAIVVDPGQLQTALLNLAVNAAYAMPTGGTLTIDTTVEGAKGETVSITMSDTGAGMSQETLAQAFEPFFTTKGLNGTGLGLSMVQGFVAQSGGVIRVDSTPGAGTTIVMELPAVVAGIASSETEVQKTLPTLHGSRRILLVDDTADVLVTTSAFLRRQGFQVMQATGGEQAIALLTAGERFDAIVTDYSMPKMHGAELIRQARTMQPALPAVIITGFANSAHAEQLPAVAVLRKPFLQEHLKKAVLLAMAQGAPASVAD